MGRLRAGRRADPVLCRALLRHVQDRAQPEVPRRQPDRAAARVVARDDGLRDVLRRSRPRRAADCLSRVVPVRRLPPAHEAAALPRLHRDRVVRRDGARALSQQTGHGGASRRNPPARRAHGDTALVCGDGRLRQPLARRDDRHQSRARRREGRRRSGRASQEHVPRQHEPRDSDADERRDRHDHAAARHQALRHSANTST